MSTVPLIQYEDASAEVREVFDAIKAARNVADVNNFWKALANHPATLKRTWESLSEVMKPGSLDSLTKEMIYIAVSIANNCDYCIHSHTASAFAKGMTPAQYGELLVVVAMAHETNALSTAFKVSVDPQFLVGKRGSEEERKRLGDERMSLLAHPFISQSLNRLIACLPNHQSPIPNHRSAIGT